jgi:hypothetical protein
MGTDSDDAANLKWFEKLSRIKMNENKNGLFSILIK